MRPFLKNTLTIPVPFHLPPKQIQQQQLFHPRALQICLFNLCLCVAITGQTWTSGARSRSGSLCLVQLSASQISVISSEIPFVGRFSLSKYLKSLSMSQCDIVTLILAESELSRRSSVHEWLHSSSAVFVLYIYLRGAPRPLHRHYERTNWCMLRHQRQLILLILPIDRTSRVLIIPERTV